MVIRSSGRQEDTEMRQVSYCLSHLRQFLVDHFTRGLSRCLGIVDGPDVLDYRGCELASQFWAFAYEHLKMFSLARSKTQQTYNDYFDGDEKNNDHLHSVA